MEMVVFGIMSLLAVALNFINTYETNKDQERLAKESDKRQLENQKILMDYQNQLQQDTNTIATQKGHAAAAGYNPALLYGNMPGLAQISGGSSQGTMPELKLPDIAGRLNPGEASNLMIQRKQADILQQRTNSDIELSHSQALLNNARTVEQLRDTGQKRSLERIVYDTAFTNLQNLRTNYEQNQFNLETSKLMRPAELEKANLVNREIATNITKVEEEIKTSPVMRAKLRADMKFIDSQIERNSHQNQVSDAQLQEIQQTIKSTAVERIMQQFGLVNRSLPAFLRKDQIENYYLRQPQLIGAVSALVEAGFTVDEATRTAIYYTASNAKDVSPSLVNAVSRGISALILKK